MRVVHVSIGALPPVFTDLGGAIQRRVGELARAQAQRGHEVVVFSPGHERSSTQVDGVAVEYVPLRLPSPWSRLEYQARVVRELRRSHRAAEVLHFHSEPEGARLARGLDALTVMSYDYYEFRGGRDSRLYRFNRGSLLAYDVLLPCSHYCQAESCAYWSVPPERTEVLFNGVSVEQFRPDAEAAARERAREQVAGPVVFYLGRVCAQKGSDTLLEAFGELRRELPEVELLIAGPVGDFTAGVGADERATWTERMRRAGARYLGAVPEERLVGLLNMADVFVMPTRKEEMFGMAAVEAEACGTPVVASDHGGLREVVPEGAGVRFPPGDASALARALAELLGDQARRTELGRGAAESARRYAWERIAADFEEIYRRRGPAG
jgi:glycosyltransferase involved in cell wall biosynthesis